MSGGHLIRPDMEADIVKFITARAMFVSDEDIVDANEMKRAMCDMLGTPYTPKFSDEEVAAAQARIDAKRQRQREAWLALTARERLRRRLRLRASLVRQRIDTGREALALRIAPWLDREDE